jgi:hypothetical protein
MPARAFNISCMHFSWCSTGMQTLTKPVSCNTLPIHTALSCRCNYTHPHPSGKQWKALLCDSASVATAGVACWRGGCGSADRDDGCCCSRNPSGVTGMKGGMGNDIEEDLLGPHQIFSNIKQGGQQEYCFNTNWQGDNKNTSPIQNARQGCFEFTHPDAAAAAMAAPLLVTAVLAAAAADPGPAELAAGSIIPLMVGRKGTTPLTRDRWRLPLHTVSWMLGTVVAQLAAYRP